MSNSIQGMRVVFDVVKNARNNNSPMTNEEIQQLLLKLVPDENVRKRYNNFSQGYAAEELFRRIYSLLPWVKLVTPLGQEQYPEKSKVTMQVPDYEVIFEAGSPEASAKVLIEAKLVSSDKQTLKLQKYKYNVLRKYELEAGIPLIFAIFWQKHALWTLNSIESFSEKNSEFKISFEQACRNDMSAIMGDYTYIFRKRPFRKSQFTKNEKFESKSPYFHIHEVFGNTTYEGLSLDGDAYVDLSILEPVVLDCAFDFKEISHEIKGVETELIEQLDDKNYVYKLSSLLLGFLQKICCYDNKNMFYHDNEVVAISFHIVDSTRQKCGGERFYLMPYDRATSIDSLIKLQFGDAPHIYNFYCNAKREHNYKLLCSHNG
ncbi:hypothetical protein HNQ80_005068 [Anaerosolibacter carboniphilus]|uniref:Uncharacterized protein n=1 Tax=Anaerosolibacter carboniphilus TaxID=1417629 RepID=A0A841L009_9FIRM|nr:hypothetical protein [Anaerosolibacter carboniphilus]MBB6218893.1 hypothetical protein [Anaerosolibacter carboniphilus]